MNTHNLPPYKEIILNFITEHQMAIGDTLPSIRQLQSTFLMSKYAAMTALKELCDEGYITKGISARNGYQIIKLPENQANSSPPLSLVQFILPFKGWNYVGNQLLSSVERIFSLNNCNVIFSNNNNCVDTEQKLLQGLLTSSSATRPKALLLMPSNTIANPNIELLKAIQQQMPIILVDRYIWGFDCHYVGLNNQCVGRTAFEKLYDSSHKTLAFIGGFSTISPVNDRMSGFISAMRAIDSPIDDSYIIFNKKLDLGFLSDIQPQINAIGERLLKLTPRPTGIFCSSDRIAAGLTIFFINRGYSVPEDFAIIGCDNDTELASSCPISIASFSHPFDDMAKTIYNLSNNNRIKSLPPYYHTEYTPGFIPGNTWK